MSGRRHITGTILRTCFGACRKEVTPSKVLGWVLEEIATCQRDLDKTGDVDAADYYAGCIDAYEQVALWIAPLKEEKTLEFWELLGKVFVPKGEQP